MGSLRFQKRSLASSSGSCCKPKLAVFASKSDLWLSWRFLGRVLDTTWAGIRIQRRSLAVLTVSRELLPQHLGRLGDLLAFFAGLLDPLRTSWWRRGWCLLGLLHRLQSHDRKNMRETVRFQPFFGHLILWNSDSRLGFSTNFRVCGLSNVDGEK